ncbi:MAG: PAS domain-containing protein, partial [Gammaproteobacteria bacterium]|nr:PAS domain-containing protein [Gammaproteobacteria bacterium]MCD8524935.1 PAS domain-containing protein [Gammaproteobacteria bacterium]MCD8542680.1 PAS domain-containing protein [Gammaproteobacteria bacterium]MCD8573724.1 PAS domain-containing protein [Gammaproteobacteria bacterium]
MKDKKDILKLGSFLSQLADKSEHVYWLSSADFKKIEYISPAYEAIWGRKVDELYKNPDKWITFLHPDDVKNHHPITAMKERIEQLGASARYREDYRIIRPDGTVRWIMDRGFPIYDEEGLCCGVTGIALDVTKEKEAELALEKAKEKAEAANRAKTEFLANMSHDVKSPMTGIVMSSDLMMRDPAW